MSIASTTVKLTPSQLLTTIPGKFGTTVFKSGVGALAGAALGDRGTQVFGTRNEGTGRLENRGRHTMIGAILGALGAQAV
jgi:hypothetical protein